MTLPNTTCSTSAGAIEARSIAATAAIVPSCDGGTEARPPPKEPIAVRAAELITTSVTDLSSVRQWLLAAKHTCP
jgi:hypothetical protein